MEEREVKKSKVFNIMQYLTHKNTGEKLIDEDIIKSALQHKTITGWAYILHDEDVYTKEDEKDGKGKAGTLKPPHYHIVLRLNTSTEVDTIAKWFQIQPNFVDTPKGYAAFWDCVEYLTHEKKDEKHLYADSEVEANFNFREELDKRNRDKQKFGKVLSVKERFREAVLSGEKTPDECRIEDPINYADDLDKLKKLRRDYLATLPPPHTRINYYISGNASFGKGLTSRALARALFPNIEKDENIFFVVGAEDVGFEGYDGQPVIIWDDHRAGELILKLKGRGNVFNVFDTHPTKARQNVKYGSVNLVNMVNIVNSVEPYEVFLDGLAGEYVDKDGRQMKAEDKNQSYRRFPFIIPLHEDDFDFLVNKGFFYGNGLFTEWEEYNHIRGNMQKIRIALKGNEQLARQIDTKMMALPKAKFDEVLNSTKEEMSEAEIEEKLKLFEGFGEIVEAPIESDDKAEIEDDNEELPF